MKPIDYQQLAADYALNRRVHPDVLRQLATAVPGPASHIVEVGSGTGNYIIALQAATQCRATGIEPSAAMLEQARVRDSPVDWIQAPGEALPLEADSVDLLFTVDVAHHLRDRIAFFREAMRVLKVGGSVCMVTDSDEDIANRIPLAAYFPETIAVDRARYPGVATLQAEAEVAGLANQGLTRAIADYPLTDISPYRARAYSCLHLITDDAWRRGLERLEADLAQGGVNGCSRYTLVWSAKR